MLSDKDIDKLMNVFATKDEVRSIVREEIQEEVRGMKEVAQKTYEVVESLASQKETERFEDAARDSQLSRHDVWIKQIANEKHVKLVDA